MKERYVVLRSLYGDGQVYYGMSKSGAQKTGLVSDLEELDPIEAAAVAREPGVEASCLAMPMTLIRPVEDNGSAAPAAAGVTWGVRAVGADTVTLDGRGITVAVLDTGIDASHEAFAGMELVQQDFTGKGNGDTDGHGTHCAATIFGRNVGGTRIGVAPGVTRALIGKVVADDGYETWDVTQAILWAAAHGANVISMSIGIDFPGWVTKQVANGVSSQLAASRAQAGYGANILLFKRLNDLLGTQPFYQPAVIVAAAGNESQRGKNPPEVIRVSPPAAADGIVSVASLGEGVDGLTVAPSSNGGATVSAPGVLITSAATGGGLSTKSGTSMATPHVAGVAALWAQQLKATGRLTSVLLKSSLIASARTASLRAGSSSDDVGAGLVSAPQA